MQNFRHLFTQYARISRPPSGLTRRIHSSGVLRYEEHGNEISAPYNPPSMGLVVEDSENEYILTNKYDLSEANIAYKKTLGFKPKRVLVLSKTTRWEILSPKAGTTKISSENILRQKHEQQLAYIEEISDQLSKHGIEVTVVKANDYTPEAIKNAQLVISAGGDGTFLAAASMIRDSTPCIGINTDPVGSEGHLCLTGKEDCNVREVLDRFLGGHFSFFPRHRIRVTLLKTGSTEHEAKRIRNDSIQDDIPHEVKFCSDDEEAAYRRPEIPTPLLALNEVFVGESHAARVSYLEVQLDDGEVYKQKNSGIIVCTGTGSTSWHFNINRLTEQNFSDVLQKMHDLGYRVQPPLNSNGIEELCQEYNERLIFAPDEKKMVYSIRDPVFNYTYPKIPPRGTARRIRIKSKCSHAHMTLDGSTSIPFNYGAEALIELYEEDALKTAILT